MIYEPLLLTKFDVAERQLHQAIRMFFTNEDPVSIHTLAGAAGQVFSDIGKADGVKSIMRDNARIRPERYKEWLQVINASRNFFKHADKDSSHTHTFREMLNHTFILDAALMHYTLKPGWTPETILFNIWFSKAHPKIMAQNESLTALRDQLLWNNRPLDHEDRSTFAEVIAVLRSHDSRIPNLSYHLGQQRK